MAEVTGDHAPAEVSDEAILAMIRTAPQPVVPAQAAQSSLDPGTPAIAVPPGARLLHDSLRLTHDAGTRDQQVRDPGVSSHLFVLLSVQSPIPRCQPGWSIKELPMMVQGRCQLSLLGRLVLQHGKSRNNTTASVPGEHHRCESSPDIIWIRICSLIAQYNDGDRIVLAVSAGRA